MATTDPLSPSAASSTSTSSSAIAIIPVMDLSRPGEDWDAVSQADNALTGCNILGPDNDDTTLTQRVKDKLTKMTTGIVLRMDSHSDIAKVMVSPQAELRSAEFTRDFLEAVEANLGNGARRRLLIESALTLYNFAAPERFGSFRELVTALDKTTEGGRAYAEACGMWGQPVESTSLAAVDWANAVHASAQRLLEDSRI